MAEQVVKVLGKLDKWKYPEYNLGYNRTTKLNVQRFDPPPAQD